MKDQFECLVTGQHDYSVKCPKGNVCSQCGMLAIPDSKNALKSNRYSSKVHFNVGSYEESMLTDAGPYKLTNQAYIKQRSRLVKFILDKGRVLKMSLKTLHQCVFLMDVYIEKTGYFPKTAAPGFPDEQLLLAASVLLIGSKSSELDERIPFIPKLRKYTELLDFSNSDFKKLEVKIGQALDWDLQRSTFYSYLELYLSYGVLTDDDLVERRLVDIVKAKCGDPGTGAEDGVRNLAKQEQSRGVITWDMLSRGGFGSPGKPPRPSSSSGGYVKLGTLDVKLKGEIVKVFELYARDLSNLVLRECRDFWTLTKPTTALAIIAYTRSAMVELCTVWSPRLDILGSQPTDRLKEAFGKVEEFIRGTPVDFSSNTSSSKVSPLKTPILSTQGSMQPSFVLAEIGALKVNSMNMVTPINHQHNNHHNAGKFSIENVNTSKAHPTTLSSSASKTNTSATGLAPGPKLKRQHAVLVKENSPNAGGGYY